MIEGTKYPHYYVIPGLKNRVMIKRNTSTTLEIILGIVCEVLELRKEKVLSKNRKQELVMGRHVTMYLIRHHTTATLQGIGAFFKQHHTTITHACQSVQDLIETDEVYRKQFNQIEEKVYLTIQ